MSTQSRKKEHIAICLTQNVQSGLRTGFDDLYFEHQALPNISFAEITTNTQFLGRKVKVPILFSSMTGGTDETGNVNFRLAEAAEEIGGAMGLGSMRIALERPESIESFRVRKIAPHVLLFANIGAIQLNYGVNIEDCKRLVDLVEADGLILHLNPLQEALQPEGNTNFKNLYIKIEQLCTSLDVPVIAKEVGWGISSSTAMKLIDCGIAAIDVAGAGGTSWSEVEKHRIIDMQQANVAGEFKEWGISTVESLRQIRNINDEIPLIASGGMKNGIDLAKSIALGACLGGFARKLLSAAVISTVEILKVVSKIIHELRITMFVSGAERLEELNGKLK